MYCAFRGHYYVEEMAPAVQKRLHPYFAPNKTGLSNV